MSVEMLRVSLPVRNDAQSIVGVEAREVLFLCARNESRSGYGECAPLAGLHIETLDECMLALEEWSDGLIEIDALAPSAACAASMALETLDGFGARAVQPVRVAQLFAGALAQCTDAALHELRDARVVKLKFGRASEADERELLTRFMHALPAAHFRIDANQRLTLDECVARLRGIDAHRIEYLEDPLRDASHLAALSSATGIKIALDETALDQSTHAHTLRAQLARSGCVAAWILRMSTIGSLDAIRARAAEAAHFGADVVLSTAFESSYALRVAAHLAASIPNATRAHGIGTASLLAEDSCEPAVIRGGMLDGSPLPIPFAEAWS